MRFNLAELNPGVWFDLNPDDPSAGRICLRPANAEFLERAQKLAVRKRVEWKKGFGRTEWEESDNDKYRELLWDYCIVDWEGIEDENGNPIPCTTEHKLLLLTHSVTLLNIVRKCLDVLNEQEEQRLESLEKNLSSTSGGSEKSQTATCAEPYTTGKQGTAKPASQSSRLKTETLSEST